MFPRAVEFLTGHFEGEHKLQITFQSPSTSANLRQISNIQCPLLYESLWGSRSWFMTVKPLHPHENHPRAIAKALAPCKDSHCSGRVSRNCGMTTAFRLWYLTSPKYHRLVWFALPSTFRTCSRTWTISNHWKLHSKDNCHNEGNALDI